MLTQTSRRVQGANTAAHRSNLNVNTLLDYCWTPTQKRAYAERCFGKAGRPARQSRLLNGLLRL